VGIWGRDYPIIARAARGSFLGELLRWPPAASDFAFEKKNCDLIVPGMIRTLRGDDLVAKGIISVDGLHPLLKATFGIVGLAKRLEPVGEASINCRHNAPGRGQAPVQIQGAD
jgi:hypothetical protein